MNGCIIQRVECINRSEDVSASQSSRVQDEGMNNEPDFMKERLEDGDGEHDDVELREEDEEKKILMRISCLCRFLDQVHLEGSLKQGRLNRPSDGQ